MEISNDKDANGNELISKMLADQCATDIVRVIDNSDNYDNGPKKNSGLFSITNNLKTSKSGCRDFDTSATAVDEYGDSTTSSTEAIESSAQLPMASKVSTAAARKRHRLDRTNSNNGLITTPTTAAAAIAAVAAVDYAIHNNNNNHVKNERLSPGTPDTSSRSRSVTPSSVSHPGTPPASENPLLSASSRNYSDYMRSLAAKYNNANPNDYFNSARNGFPPPMDPRFKHSAVFPGFFPGIPLANLKECDINLKKADMPVMNPFATNTNIPPMMDMSSTQALMAIVRTAKEAELQNLLKNVKRQDASSPLDLSAAAPPPAKKVRTKTSSSGSPCGASSTSRAKSESPIMHEDISHWSVDDVCNFIGGIDICAEYTQNFRNERIDGAGLPLLTEDHLTNKMNMKLGPALKLRSILAKKLGTCTLCLHCTHCHNNNTSSSPEPANNTGNSSDSGGNS